MAFAPFIPPWLRTGTEDYLQAAESGQRIAQEKQRTQDEEIQFAISQFQHGMENAQRLRMAKKELQVHQQESSQRLKYLHDTLDAREQQMRNQNDIANKKIAEITRHNKDLMDASAAKLKEKTDHDSAQIGVAMEHAAQLQDMLDEREKGQNDRQDKGIKAAKDLQTAREQGQAGNLVDVRTPGKEAGSYTERKVPKDQYDAYQRLVANPGSTTNNIPATSGFMGMGGKPPSQQVVPNIPPTLDTFLATNRLAGALPPSAPAAAPNGVGVAPTTPPTTGNVPPTPTRADVTALAKYPQLKDHFEAQFGKGSADQWLP